MQWPNLPHPRFPLERSIPLYAIVVLYTHTPCPCGQNRVAVTSRTEPMRAARWCRCFSFGYFCLFRARAGSRETCVSHALDPTNGKIQICVTTLLSAISGLTRQDPIVHHSTGVPSTHTHTSCSCALQLLVWPWYVPIARFNPKNS